MCYLCIYICTWLDILVFSDKEEKIVGPVSCIFSSMVIAGDVKEPTHPPQRIGNAVPGVVV